MWIMGWLWWLIYTLRASSSSVHVVPHGTTNSDCISYSKIINFANEWLDSGGNIIIQWGKGFKEQTIVWFKKSGRTKKMIKVGTANGEYHILTV